MRDEPPPGIRSTVQGGRAPVASQRRYHRRITSQLGSPRGRPHPVPISRLAPIACILIRELVAFRRRRNPRRCRRHRPTKGGAAVGAARVGDDNRCSRRRRRTSSARSRYDGAVAAGGDASRADGHDRSGCALAVVPRGCRGNGSASTLRCRHTPADRGPSAASCVRPDRAIRSRHRRGRRSPVPRRRAPELSKPSLTAARQLPPPPRNRAYQAPGVLCRAQDPTRGEETYASPSGTPVARRSAAHTSSLPLRRGSFQDPATGERDRRRRTAVCDRHLIRSGDLTHSREPRPRAPFRPGQKKRMSPPSRGRRCSRPRHGEPAVTAQRRWTSFHPPRCHVIAKSIGAPRSGRSRISPWGRLAPLRQAANSRRPGARRNGVPDVRAPSPSQIRSFEQAGGVYV